MTSTAPTTSTPINAPSAKSASPSAAASGTTSNNARSSYANAATKGSQPGGSPAALGGLALSHHAHSNSQSPVNGRPSAPPAVPTGPAIVSSTNGTSDHTRTPSVTITAQGSSYVPNGTATGPSRPNISFGSIGAGASPSPSMSTPHLHTTSVPQPYGGPNPARSPSPIPPPPVSSGGRPPSSLAGTNPVNFGSLPGGEGSDQSQQPFRHAIPSGPQNSHLRRESSHSDNSNRNFAPQNGGRSASGRPQYPNQNFPGASAAHSPSMFRPGLNMNQRTPSNNLPPFQQQMRGQNSPYQTARSPMPPHAQPHLANGSPMPHPYGYNAQMPQEMYMPPAYSYGQYPAYHPNGAYMPGMQQMPMPYGQAAPQMPQQSAAPFRTPGSYAPPIYPTGPGANPMSRTSSASGLDPRPTSSMGQSPAPSPSPAPTANSFTRPKKTNAIRITNPDGTVVDFKKSVQSPAAPSPAPRGPAVVSSGGAPPVSSTPDRTLTPSSQHSRAESVAAQAKTADEKKKEFEEAVKRQLEQQEKDNEAKKDKDAADAEPAEPEAVPAPEKAEETPEEAKEEPKTEPEAEPAAAEETEEERKKREDDEEMERMIAEMEAHEKAEEERERAFQEKKKKEAEEKALKEAEAAKNLDEEMKRAEREAEEREEAKLKGKTEGDSDAEAQNLFAQLKKSGLGPSAGATTSEASTPGSESPMPPPAQPASQMKPAPLGGKTKPAALKLETAKTVEPAPMTAGMQALKTSRFLQVQNESITYPEHIRSPNPALNTAKSKGQRYDNTFLLQFREVFKEKPSVDWDKVVKDTVGDGTDSARPQSARQPSMGGRSLSNRPAGVPAMGAMGTFAAANNRSLPPGTTSEQRFQASMQPGRPAQMPFGNFPAGRPGGAFPMAPGMVRSPSAQSMQGMNSPRNASQRGKGSRRGAPSAAQEAELRKKMPLTAGIEVKALELSASGWKPTSVVGGAPQVTPDGHLNPELVQRKVKANLNKLTPDNFDRITQVLLDIASQSKDETDGRTLRQVIALTFEKACDEAHWASMYARFCHRMLVDMGDGIRDENVRDKNGQVVVGGALFRKYLLNRCQEEFERGWDVNLPKTEGQSDEAAMLSDEYYVAAAAKRKGLGLIQFIGELYKLQMLTLRIMHECVVKLLNFEGIPDEAAIESLVKLLRTIGSTMDADPKGHSMIDTYMDRVEKIRNMEGLPSRLFYMLLDTLELRKKQWRSKDDLKGPKTIAEIREDAAAAQAAAEMERQRSARGTGGRPPAGRGDARSFSGNMPAPDYPRNQVGMDDLKRLTRNARNTTSSGPSNLGPSSLLSSSRSGSRRGLGPRADGESGASSRTGTPPVKDKESAASANAYSALAALEGDHPDDVASPPSQHASPALTRAQPAAAGEADAGKS